MNCEHDNDHTMANERQLNAADALWMSLSEERRAEVEREMELEEALGEEYAIRTNQQLVERYMRPPPLISREEMVATDTIRRLFGPFQPLERPYYETAGLLDFEDDYSKRRREQNRFDARLRYLHMNIQQGVEGHISESESESESGSENALLDQLALFHREEQDSLERYYGVTWSSELRRMYRMLLETPLTSSDPERVLTWNALRHYELYSFSRMAHDSLDMGTLLVDLIGILSLPLSNIVEYTRLNPEWIMMSLIDADDDVVDDALRECYNWILASVVRLAVPGETAYTIAIMMRSECQVQHNDKRGPDYTREYFYNGVCIPMLKWSRYNLLPASGMHGLELIVKGGISPAQAELVRERMQ